MFCEWKARHASFSLPKKLIISEIYSCYDDSTDNSKYFNKLLGLEISHVFRSFIYWLVMFTFIFLGVED